MATAGRAESAAAALQGILRLESCTAHAGGSKDPQQRPAAGLILAIETKTGKKKGRAEKKVITAPAPAPHMIQPLQRV